jgi:hypothetical protein
MRSVSQIIYPALIALVLIATSGVKADARHCDTVLPDGRVIRPSASVDEHGRTCDEFFAGRREQTRDDIARREFELRQAQRPSTAFTTGNIGPFTTGEIGPFTTFSNSPSVRHR